MATRRKPRSRFPWFRVPQLPRLEYRMLQQVRSALQTDQHGALCELIRAGAPLLLAAAQESQAAPEPASAPVEEPLVVVTLMERHWINGTPYGPGRASVPESLAADLLAADRRAQELRASGRMFG